MREIPAKIVPERLARRLKRKASKHIRVSRFKLLTVKTLLGKILQLSQAAPLSSTRMQPIWVLTLIGRALWAEKVLPGKIRLP